MGVTSYFEFVTTLLGWVLYDNIFSVIADSGLVFVPFLVVIISHVINTRKAGDDEGSAAVQSVKRIETDIYVTLFVLIIAVVPASDVTLGEMHYVKPALNCKLEQETFEGESTGTTTDYTLDTIGGEAGRIPIWWGIMHMISKSVTAASVAALPCSYDLASIESTLSNDIIEDGAVRREFQQFMGDCFAPGFGRMLSAGDTNDAAAPVLPADRWIGSERLVTEYYPQLYARLPRSDYPFDANRDKGFEGDRNIGGHPRCNEWWAGGQGLRSKLLNSINSATLQDMVYDQDNLVNESAQGNYDTNEREDIVLRKYLDLQFSPGFGAGTSLGVSYDRTLADVASTSRSENTGLFAKLGSMISGSATEFGKESLATVAGAVGAVVNGPSHVLGGKVLRESVTFAQGLLLLMFVALLPFLLLFSMFRLQYIITLSVIYFAMHFLTFIWALAYWLDNNMVAMLAQGRGFLGVFTIGLNPSQVLSLVWMERFLYMVLPLTWLTMLGWVGFSAGRAMHDMGAISSSGASVTESGVNEAKGFATKGMPKGRA